MHRSWQTRAQHGIPSSLGLHEEDVLEKQVPAFSPPPLLSPLLLAPLCPVPFVMP